MTEKLIFRVRVFGLLALTWVAFGLIGWRLLPHNGAPTLLHVSIPRIMVVAAPLCIIMTALALVIYRQRALEFAALAVSGGLTIWAVRSSSTLALIQNTPEVAERLAAFRAFAGQTVVWAALLAVSLAFVFLIEWVTANKTPDAAKPADLAKTLINNALGLVAACLVAVILLHVLARAGQTPVDGANYTTVPRKAQLVFAVAAAFFVGAIVAEQVFKSHVLTMVAAPLPVALVLYLRTARESLWAEAMALNGPFLPISAAPATVLPIQFIAVGAFAAVWGYWFSLYWFHDWFGLQHPERAE